MCFEIEKRAAQTWPTLASCAVVRVTDSEDDEPTIEDARLAFANADDIPVRTPDAEAAVTGEPLSEDRLDRVEEVVYEAVNPQDEEHASETYKRELAGALGRRAVRRAYDRACGDD